jgi:NAD-dependent deacetylase
MPDVRNIVILTGAGISAESGLPLSRAGRALGGHRVEDVATPRRSRAIRRWCSVSTICGGRR